MAEIESSVLARACLKGRDPDEEALQRNISVYGAERDAAAAIINWRFTAKDARAKLPRLHPDTSTFTRRWPLSEVHRKMEGAQGSPASTGGCVAGRPKPSWGAWTSKSVSASRARQPHRMTLPPKILAFASSPWPADTNYRHALERELPRLYCLGVLVPLRRTPFGGWGPRTPSARASPEKFPGWFDLF